MSELILTTKRNIIDYLSSHPDLLYCEVVPDWIAEEQEKPFEKPIIVVQPINTDTGETQSGSLYATGNWVDMRFNVDVWTDKKTGGTIERDRIASKLFSIFNFKGVNELQIAHGIKSKGMTGGTPIFEPEPQIYRCRMVLEVSALLQAEEEPPEEAIFEDDFTGGIKPEWAIIVGPWEHNSELDALQIIYELKGKIKVDITTPDDVLVECKIIELNALENAYFDLLNRYSFDTDSGYSIAYVEVYSRLYGLALTIFNWTSGSRSPGLVYKTWAELGLTGVADLAGKTIGIRCEGNVIKGYLDGNEIMSVIDDTYLSGQAGMIANTRTEAFIFDDFKIKE